MSTVQYTEEFIKVEDQTVTNSTLVQDSVLTFVMNPQKTYKVQIFIPFMVAGLLPSYKWSLSGPTGTAFVIVKNALMINGATALTISSDSAFDTVHNTVSITSGGGILQIDAVVRTVDDYGDFTFNFACNSGTSVTNLGGAYMRYDYGLII